MTLAVRTPERRDRVSVPFALFAAYPALATVVVVAGVIPLVRGRADNPAGLPVAFVVMGAVLLLFAVGYLAMSRHIPNGGSLYAYAAHGLGRPAGLGAAWLSLATYGLLQVSLYGLVGVAASQVADRLFGTDVSWWVAALTAWLIVALTGLFPARVKGWIVVAVGGLGLTVVSALVATLAFGPDGATDAAGPELVGPTALVAATGLLLPAVYSFAGIESVSRFATAGRLHRRGLSAITYGILVGGGALFALAAWAVVAHPSIVDTQTALRVLEDRLPPAVVAIAAMALLAAVLAALVIWQDALLRLSRSLRLERVQPGSLPVPRRPLSALAIAAAPSLAVLVLVAALQLDPVSWLLLGAGMVGSYGLLILLLLTSVAVLVFFARDARQEPVPQRLLAPGTASLLLVGAAALSAAHLDRLLGIDGALAWGIAVTIPLIAGAGATAATFLRLRRPHRYEAIGLGPNAITGNPEADHVSPPSYVATHSALISH